MTDKTIVVNDDTSVEIQIHNPTTGRSIVCGSRKYESVNKPSYMQFVVNQASTAIREIVSSIILLAHSKGAKNEGFVNADLYIELLEEEAKKAFQAGEAQALKNAEKGIK